MITGEAFVIFLIISCYISKNKIDFISNLLNRGLTGIEYFGPELDNPECSDEDMIAAVSEITYLNFTLKLRNQLIFFNHYSKLRNLTMSLV